MIIMIIPQRKFPRPREAEETKTLFKRSIDTSWDKETKLFETKERKQLKKNKNSTSLSIISTSAAKNM